MTAEQIAEMMASGADDSKLIAELKLGRSMIMPSTSEYKGQIDPTLHDVMDRIKRPDKKVKMDASEVTSADRLLTVSGSGDTDKVVKLEPVARVALAIQQLIVKRAVAFLFGNPVLINCEPEGEVDALVLDAVKRALSDAKTRTMNRRVARDLFSYTEAAELWYLVPSNNRRYGFDSAYKLRCALLSPAKGDKLYPYFDESGDMIAFSREYTIEDEKKNKHTFFDTYTADEHRRWEYAEGQTWQLCEGYPKKNAIGKIPVVYACQPKTEWADVQNLIDRLEKLLSNFADTNDYHASPKIVTKGQINGWSQKGEAGAIIEMDEGGSAEYLSWSQAPEAVRLEIETLLKMIYTITQTPDISFDTVKGIGAVSGVALKLLFMDAHLKVQDKCETFDDYLQRRINVVTAFLAQMNAQDHEFSAMCSDIVIEPEIQPYMLTDEQTQVNTLVAAVGGKAIISRKTAVNTLGWVNDSDAELESIEDEEGASAMNDIMQPSF